METLCGIYRSLRQSGMTRYETLYKMFQYDIWMLKEIHRSLTIRALERCWKLPAYTSDKDVV